MLREPIGVKLGNYRGHIQKITVMEMMVIVITVPKVNVNIIGSSLVDYSAPCCFISWNC